MLDRYAVRDMDGKPSVGDLVVVRIERFFERTGKDEVSKEIGKVITESPNNTYDIILVDESKPEADWEYLSSIPRSRFEVLVEKSWFDISDRVTKGAAKAYPGDTVYKKRLNQFLKEEAFLSGGRILAALGREDNLDLTFFNCFVSQIPKDSRWGITQHFGNIFEIFSRGGGCGWTLDIFRPRGSNVRGVNGRSSGPCSWASHYAHLAKTVEQGGSRRGASMQALSVWHPDVLEFIKIKSEKETFICSKCGHSHQQLVGNWQGSNVSVIITNEFMTAVEENDIWELKFPDTLDPEYDEVWKGDIKDWISRGKKVDVYKTMRARELLDLIVHHAWTVGDPGMLFVDRANELSNSYYFSKLVCSNPCVTGDTRIYTKGGMVTARDLYNRQTSNKVIVDGRFDSGRVRTASSVFRTGKKPAYRLLTKKGYTLGLTEDHQIMTPSGWKPLCDLKSGDKIHILNQRGGFGNQGSRKLGHVLGWLVGDGWVTKHTAVLGFHHRKRKLANRFARWVHALVKYEQTKNREYPIAPVNIPKSKEKRVSSLRLKRRLVRDWGIDLKELHLVPEVVFQGTRKCQQAFLKSLFTADGSVNSSNPEKGATIRLSSSYPDLLSGVQQLLLNFAIVSMVRKCRPEHETALPDGRGGYKEYDCKAQYELIIGKDNLVRFMDQIGFLLPYKTKAANDYLDSLTRGPYREKFVDEVKEITKLGKRWVYDIVEPSTHSFIANGIVVHNCGEQLLPIDGVCNLGHLNLSKFLTNFYEQYPSAEVTHETALEGVDWEKLRQGIEVGVKFLNGITDLNKYHNDSMKELALQERRIGLGVFGLGEMLIRLGLRYGSPECISFLDDLFSFFKEESYLASVDLARTHGAFPAYNSRYLESEFIQSRLSKKTQDLISKYGIRNVTVNSIAPTGSIGTMVGTSTGLEPYIARRWTARSRLGATQETINVWEELEEKFGDSRKWPSYVVVAGEISPIEHVKVQSTIQWHIDASVSKTVNLPKNATEDDVKNVFLEAYKRGCKGVTVFRDQCRGGDQVLFSEDEVPECVEVEEEHVNETNPFDEEITVEVEQKFAGNGSHGILKPKIKTGRSVTDSRDTPVGVLHSTIRFHPITGEPYDLFCESGGGDIGADTEAIGRLGSAIMRFPNNEFVSQETRLQIIQDQLLGIRGSNKIGFGPDAVFSLPDGIAKMIKDFLQGEIPLAGLPSGVREVDAFVNKLSSLSKAEMKEYILTGMVTKGKTKSCNCGPDCKCKRGETQFEEDPEKPKHLDYCPQCRNATLVTEGGCNYCIDQQCNYSAC
jgi:ribonucleoside-diphosphate reductase alpha chain